MPIIRPFICQNCLQAIQRTSFKTRRIATLAAPSPPVSGAAKLSNRKLISLHGPDAPKFLQGIITNNVNSESAQSSGFFAAFLTAQGKVLHDVFIYPSQQSAWSREHYHDDERGYLVEVDAEEAQRLVTYLKKHKLRSKFKLRVLDEGELAVWSVWREDDRWTQHKRGKADSDIIRTQDSRAPGMGQRLLLPAAGLNSVPDLEAEEAPMSAYTIRRYIKGVAEGQQEIPREESLPMNYNFDLMGGIDFKKGCYIGQELTIRTHHTGVVRRRVLPVRLYDAAGTSPTDIMYDPDLKLPTVEDVDIKRDTSKKRATGKLIASIGNVGLAMCRLEQMSDLKVSLEGNTYTPDDRFIAGKDETVVGVKPFVPDWIRSQIREPRIQKRVE